MLWGRFAGILEESSGIVNPPPNSTSDPRLAAPELSGSDLPLSVQPIAYVPAAEDPPWSGWDVLQIAVLTIVSIFIFMLAGAFFAQHLFYRHLDFVEVARFPLITVFAQLAAYLLVLGFMFSVVKRDPNRPFWPAIQWNWPKNWPRYLVGGVVLSFALQGFAHLLPMPKELPIDRFFQTTAEAWALSIFGMTLAPLLEELFFRGFLFPVLVRRLGMFVAIILTAATFGLLHAPQLARAWGPVLVVFLVGLILTITRAITKSVAAGVLMHIAYNGTISVLIFLASGGFRHLDRLNQ